MPVADRRSRPGEVAYSENVVLLHPKRGWQEMSLAEAVRATVLLADPLDRLAATILLDDAALLTFSEIEAIYSRPEFPA